MIEELYINDIYIELGEDSKIGVTLQVNDISNLSGRNGNYSNEFKVPKTKDNQIALEFSSGLNSNSTIPYKKNTARYVQNGIDIIANGIAIVTGYDGYYKIQVTSGNGNPFELMAQRSLTDIDFSDLEDSWTMANVIAANANSDGVVWPIIDYNGASVGTRQIDVRRLLPAIWGKTIFDRILTAIGYTYTGDFKTEEFENLIIPLATDNGIDDFDIDIIASANVTPDTTNGEFCDVGVLTVKNVDINNNWTFGDLFNDENLNITQGWRLVADVSVVHDFAVSLPYTSTGTGQIILGLVVVELGIVVNVLEYVQVAAGTAGTITINQSRYLEVGDVVAMAVMTPTTDTITFGSTSTFHVVRPQVSENAIFGSLFPIAVNLPNIKQSDFIKLICQKYNLSFQTNENSKNIHFNSFKQITKNIPIAKDWSGKMDIESVTIEYVIGNYAQSNVFQYTPDESVNFGNLLQSGIITVNNENLPLSQIAVQSPFAETEMTTKLNGLDVPYINKYDVITDSFSLAALPRILYLDKQNIAALTYLDGSSTSPQTNDIPLCYFVLPNKSNLGFANNLLENNYSELQNVLHNVKKITGNFKLNIIDISEMDFSVPVYLDVQTPKIQINGYFYLNKINNYMAGKLTQCELIRL